MKTVFASGCAGFSALRAALSVRACYTPCTRALGSFWRGRRKYLARRPAPGRPGATTFYISGAMGGLSDDERQPLGGGKAPHGCGPSMFRVVLIESMIYLLWAILEIVNAILKLLELIYRPFGACAGLLKPNDPPKHVVIVGASFGGLAAQRQLSGRRDVKVTLIDFKSYFEYTPGVPPSPRAVPRP